MGFMRASMQHAARPLSATSTQRRAIYVAQREQPSDRCPARARYAEAVWLLPSLPSPLLRRDCVAEGRDCFSSFAFDPFQDFSAGLPSETRHSLSSASLSIESSLVLTIQGLRLFRGHLKENPNLDSISVGRVKLYWRFNVDPMHGGRSWVGKN